LFSQGLRPPVVVEREIGHEPFHRAAFFFPLPQPAKFAHAQMRVRLVPGGDDGLADGELPAEVANRSPPVGLPDGRDALLFGDS